MRKVVIVGVDVSKLTFDACWQGGRAEFSNDADGFVKFVAAIPARAHVVMEATGTYHLRLATWLHGRRYRISVVNSAQPAHFARMKLKRAKTDQVDANVVFQFGVSEQPPLWHPLEDVLIELNQLDKHLVGLQSDHTRVCNRLEAINECGTVNAYTLEDLEAQRIDLKDRIKRTEREIKRLVVEHFGDLYALLQTIPGIGPRTALMFIVLTDAFRRFPSAKAFAAYVGLTSFIRKSGTSIRGSGSITKMGNGRMRQLLYMAALTAREQNQACKDFAQRLTAAGKPVKVVRIAVANKLIRQAFAVIQNQEAYSSAYA